MSDEDEEEELMSVESYDFDKEDDCKEDACKGKFKIRINSQENLIS